MTITETTAAIANALGLSYSVTDDAALLLRGGVVVGVVEDGPMADSLGVTCYYEKHGKIWSRFGGGNPRNIGIMPKQQSATRQRVEAKDIKTRYTVLDVWRLLMPQSCPLKDGVYHSPFRDDSNPSFSISQQGRKWKDFSSDEGGDCLDFWMKATGGTLSEAIAALASGASNQQVLPPEPPKEKVLAVTDVQRGFERSALDGFKEAIENDDSVLCRLLAAKGIGKHVAMSLWNEGSLGAIDGKPVYLNNFGSKIRHEAETSRSSRWLCGGSCNYVWRHRLLLSPWIQRVVITESETDAMKLMSLIPQGLRCIIVAAPSASWNPIQDMSFAIGAHREVLIWMDQDKAGIAASAKLVEVFKDVSNCKVAAAMTSDDDKKDVCEMTNERIVEVYNESCQQFDQ